MSDESADATVRVTVSESAYGCIELVGIHGPYWISHADQPVSETNNWWSQ